MAKLFIIFSSCLVALASAGFAPISYTLSEPTITSQSSNILRSPGNLAQISTYSKTVDTPFSSSSKSDVRVSSPGVYSTLSYAAPAPVVHAAPAPVFHAAPAPVLHAAPAPLLHVAPAPVLHAAPAVAAAPVVAHTTFTGLGYSYAF